MNDSSFIRSDRDSGIVYIRKDMETLKLDFSDPSNPIRILNVNPGTRLPAGVGEENPIVFPSE